MVNKFQSIPEMVVELCREKQCWGLFVCLDSSPWVEIFKAVPFLSMKDVQALLNGHVVLTFSTEGECREYYNQVVGDDGPTESNPYNGPAKAYALICNHRGQIVAENT